MKKFDTLLSNFITYYTPRKYFRNQRAGILKQAMSDSSIVERVKYYCRIAQGAKLSDDALIKTIGEYIFPYFSNYRYPFYFFDLYRVLKYFPSKYQFSYLFGDVIHEPPCPTFVKSRKITPGPTNSVIMKLDSRHHFNFIQDNLSFSQKKPICIMRNLWANDKRAQFINTYINSPKFNLGITQPSKEHPEWNKEFMSIEDQLENRYIVCIEGNDVATNLKWVMSSNSIAIMPTPVYETWYMEGQLIPDVHYIHIADDYSDVIEKMTYYDNNPAAAQKILNAQHKWVDQFRDSKKELITEVAVADQYFKQIMKP
ncbi:MAG: lipopolysaccharide A protein [Muribaculum sp.]|nr:lipopolysaccharide A protein [Muribaculum sp.]